MTVRRVFTLLLPCVLAALLCPAAAGSQDLLDEVQRRAVRFFWEKAHPTTGLVNDRARNSGTDDYTVASIASTGYALAALPIAVERGWVARSEARERAERTLSTVLRMPHEHGWLYHFVDRATGDRVWQCEVSTIDTALLLHGALVAGQFFRGHVRRDAERIYERLDWAWARTNGGAKPDKLTITHGWKPESGFLPHEWDSASELPLLYLLGLGARDGLPASSWSAWRRTEYTYGPWTTLAGGPLFLNQMTLGYYDLRSRRDALGYDYAVAAANATQAHRRFCEDRAGMRRTYAAGLWGLNASDGPRGYRAYGIPEPEDGTISPTGVLASITVCPDIALEAARCIRDRYGERAWGQYGFSNGLNLDEDWFGPDVIGIDLGMALLAIENRRTGLVWKLLARHPMVTRAYAAAGLRKTREAGERPLRRLPHRGAQRDQSTRRTAACHPA